MSTYHFGEHALLDRKLRVLRQKFTFRFGKIPLNMLTVLKIVAHSTWLGFGWWDPGLVGSNIQSNSFKLSELMKELTHLNSKCSIATNLECSVLKSF